MKKKLLITGFLFFGLAMFVLGILSAPLFTNHFDRGYYACKLQRIQRYDGVKTYQIAGAGFQGASRVFGDKN